MAIPHRAQSFVQLRFALVKGTIRYCRAFYPQPAHFEMRLAVSPISAKRNSEGTAEDGILRRF